MKNRLYLKVTEDKYELPIYVARTLKELAAWDGIKVQTARTRLSRGLKGYRKVDTISAD